MKFDINIKGKKEDALKVIEQIKEKGSDYIAQLHNMGIIENIRWLSYGNVTAGMPVTREDGGVYILIKEPDKENFKDVYKQMKLAKTPTLMNTGEIGSRATYEHVVTIGAKGGINYTFTLNLSTPAPKKEELIGIIKTIKEDPALAEMYIKEGIISSVKFGMSDKELVQNGKINKESLESFKYALKTTVGVKRENDSNFTKI
ncbi:MAG: hypothetical protein QXS93_01415 [Candidatus Micrarchaeia archaeon]